MSYMGIPRGRKKAAATIRLTIDNNGLTNNATFYSNSGVGTVVTYSTSAWFEIIASLAQNVNMVDIFDSTGYTARLGTGAPAAEVDLMLDYPGGNGQVFVRIDAGTRIALRPLVHPPSGAEVVINFWD